MFFYEVDDFLLNWPPVCVSFVSTEMNQTDTIQDYTAEDKLKFYLTQDESELTDNNIVNGNLVWGNVTIDLADVEIASLDGLNIFTILSNVDDSAVM